MKKIKLISALMIILCSVPVQAQTDENGGSLYSIFGLGDLDYTTSIRTDGMGILGLSLTGNYSN